MGRAVFVALAVWALGASAAAAQSTDSRASAETRTAETLAADARTAYREGRYEEAAELFGRAYESARVGTLLYNQARALENATRLEEAVSAYERYLATDEEIEDRAGIEERVARLRTRLEEQRRLEDERARLAAELAAQRRQVSRPVEPARTAHEISPVPFVIGGAGLLGLGAGIAVGVVADDRHQAAVAEPIQARADALQHERDDLALTANVTLVISGLAAAAGTIWAIVEIVAESEEPQVVVRIGPGGVAVAGAF